MAQEPTPAKPRKEQAQRVALSEGETTEEPKSQVVCRIYMAMPMGNGVCAFYCLEYPGCTTASGHLFSCSASTGPCNGGGNCTEVGFRGDQAKSGAKVIPPNGPDIAASVDAKLDRPPELLYNPERTKVLRKTIIKIDHTDDGKDNPVLAFLVVANIDPQKVEKIDPPAADLAFARQIENQGVDPDSEPARNVERIKPRLYRFTWNGYHGVAFLDDPK
jgi:hypothetical protein